MSKKVKRSSQSGFTLVELVIAAAILAIVITPLISNFVSTSKMNQKSRKNMNAMNLAQDIMEGMSNYTAEEVIKLFESNPSLNGTILPSTSLTYTDHGDVKRHDSLSGYNTGDILEIEQVYKGTKTPGGSNSVESRQYAVDVVSGNTVKIKTMQNKVSGGVVEEYSDHTAKTEPVKSYDFLLTDVKQANRSYDVYIRLKTDGYTDNSLDGLAYLAPVNGNYDCVYTANSLSRLPELFHNLHPTLSFMVSDFYGNLDRKLQIKIANYPEFDGSPNYQARVTETYTVSSSMAAARGMGTDTSKWTVTTVSDKNVFTGVNSDAPRNVYLYYYGTPSIGATAQDTIDVINETNKEVTVYVIRLNPTVGDAINDINNDTYKVKALNITSTNGPAGSNNYLTKIVYNLRMNLNREYDKNLRLTDESGTALPNQAEIMARYGITTSTDTGYDRFRCPVNYNGALITEETYERCISDGCLSREEPLSYKVELVVCENKGTETIPGGTQIRKGTILAEYEGGLRK